MACSTSGLNKKGTALDASGRPCRAGNYEPAWTEGRATYQVKGLWVDTLWKQYKITHEVYEEYNFKSRDGVLSRKRNLDAVIEKESMDVERNDLQRTIKRIRSNPAVYQPFPTVPAAEAWKEVFNNDRLRYPLLVVLGSSGKGKTEWACSLFRNPLKLLVGSLKFFPEGMRRSGRAVNDGLVLDDVRDLLFLSDHQEQLQGK